MFLSGNYSIWFIKEMVHWNVENGQITPLQIAENINKMSKVLLKPSLLWGINLMQFCYPFLNPLTKWIDGVILHAKRWRHNMNNLHHTFGTMLDTHCNFQIWVNVNCLYIYASGDISSFFGILNEIHWINDTFYKCLFDFYIFSPTHLSIKIRKIITYSEGTSACMCLIWEGKFT